MILFKLLIAIGSFWFSSIVFAEDVSLVSGVYRSSSVDGGIALIS